MSDKVESKVKDNTMKTYISTFNNLAKKAGSDDLDKIFTWIEKNNLVKLNTKLLYLNTLVSLKKHNSELVKGDISKISKRRDEVQEEIKKKVATNNITSGQEKAMNTVNTDKLKQFLDKLAENKNNSLDDLDTYVLVYLMTKYPVRNSFSNVKIVNLKREHKASLDNTLLLPKLKNQNGHIIIRKFKTDKTYKPIEIDLDNEISNDIRKLVKLDNRKYLFVNKNGNPYSSSCFSHKLIKVFQKEFGVNMSSTILRKIYVSDRYKDTIEAMEKDAELLGHSTNTMRERYIRNTDSPSK